MNELFHATSNIISAAKFHPVDESAAFGEGIIS